MEVKLVRYFESNGRGKIINMIELQVDSGYIKLVFTIGDLSLG